MKLKVSVAVLLTAVVAAIPAAAQMTVVINEIDYDQPSTDSAEFVEIKNVGATAVNLGTLSLELVNGTGGGATVYNTISLPSVSLAAGDYFVVCANAATVPNCDLDASPDTNFIQNGAPDAVALRQDGNLIDTVSYEGDTGAPYTEGSGAGLVDSSATDFLGISRLPDGVDTDQNNVDFSPRCITPGEENVADDSSCSEPGPPASVVINETDADTPGTDVLEFVELYDGGVGNTPLDGFVVVFFNGSTDTSYNAFDLDGHTSDVSGYFLLGNAGVTPSPDIVFPSNGLQNGADAVALYVGDASDFPTGTAVTTAGLVDAIVYDTNDADDPGLLVLLNAGQPQVNEDGSGDKDFHSNQRCPNGEGGERNTAGFVQATPSPAADNQCGGPIVGMIINEIHADPASDLSGDANGDGVRDGSQDEFVEIVNTSGGDVDISGWTLSDGFGVRHTFPTGTVIAEQCGIVVFGGGTPTGSFGNMIVQAASTGMLGLNNGGDDIILNDGSNDVATASYGSEGGDNQSLTLDPDLGTPPYVKHSVATGSGGALFSPGTRIDGSFFGGCPLPPAPLLINEIHADPASDLSGDANGDGVRDSSHDEFVEIVNVSGSVMDISGWTLSDAVGVRHTFPGGTVIPDQCGVVVFGGGTPTGSFGNMMVQTASGGFLGLNNSGDSVFLNDGSSDVATASYGSEGGDNQSLTLDPDLGSPPYVKHSVATGSGGAVFSPGTRVDGSQFGGCPVFVEIFEIQGAGAASPFDGLVVTTLENVVTATAPNGFFMQTPTGRADGDVDTSDGIFVFTGGAPTVAVGDLVNVTGEVDEFFGMTEFTSSPVVTVVGTGAVPSAISFDASVPSPDPAFPSCAIEYECYEGMLVEIADGTVTGPNQQFGSDPFAELHIVAYPQRAFREPGIEFPGLVGYPMWDGNPEVFELDPDKLGLPNQMIAAGASFSAVGVLGFEFGDYELWPSDLTVTPATVPSAVWPREPGEFTVATLNLFRLFDDVDDPPDGPRDDTVVSTAEYELRLAKFSAHIREVLDAPDILAVQEAEKLEVLEDLAAQIAADDPSISYTAYLVEGNDVGTIDVGLMVRDRIQVDAITQLGKDEILSYDGSLLHDRPPLLLEGSCQLEFGGSPIAVLAVHIRSLSGIDSPSSGERVRQKRFEQAESIATMVQDIQSANPDVRLIVAGDFNAYEFTDGYVDVVGIIKGDYLPAENLICATAACVDITEPNFTDEILDLPAEERYSFIFGGSAQTLDHALTSTGLSSEISAVAFGRGNADAAIALIEDDGTEADLSLRSSDHDGLVLFILNDEDADGVPNDLDMCPGTTIPESVPTQELGINRWALVDEDGIFDTSLPNGNGNGLDRSFTLGDTAGCSCEQIIEGLGLGKGHEKFGCSTGALRDWIAVVSD